MVDRVKLGNGKSSTILTPTLPSTYAEFKEQCEAGELYVDITPNNTTSGSDVGVSEVGTPLNTANLLSDTTATSLGLSGDNKTPDKAFAAVHEEATEEITTSRLASDFNLPVAKGGTGATTAANARTNLGVTLAGSLKVSNVEYTLQLGGTPSANYITFLT